MCAGSNVISFITYIRAAEPNSSLFYLEPQMCGLSQCRSFEGAIRKQRGARRRPSSIECRLKLEPRTRHTLGNDEISQPSPLGRHEGTVTGHPSGERHRLDGTAGTLTDISVTHDPGVVDLGLVSPTACADLYRRCSVGLCVSSSNPSRIPFEMMS